MASTAMGPARRLLRLPKTASSSPSPAFSLSAATSRRHSHHMSRKQVERLVSTGDRTSSRLSPQPSLGALRKDSLSQIYKDGREPLFPLTFVALPFSQRPKSPSRFWQYLVLHAKNWIMQISSVLDFKLKSMDSWTSFPKWKMRRGQIAPTAKAMYREMLEAFAQGDRQTLLNICQPGCASKLISAIERRDNREGWRFQVVKYNRRLRYPRVVSHRIHQFDLSDDSKATEQAVVAICSTQQASKYNKATGQTIPGTLKLQDKTEYVVLTRSVNRQTFVSTSWRIWGTVPHTTLEGYKADDERYQMVQKKEAGWDLNQTKQV